MSDAIRYLAEKPELVPTVAGWLFQQFGYMNPGASIERGERRLALRLKTQGCPVALISTRDDVPTGTVSLVDSDLEEREHLSPWLAGLYVEPGHRQCGVGGRLVEAVVDHAKRCGYARIYLFTPDRQAFFAHRGWIVIDRLHHHGVDVSVMELRL